jgi:lantibiotic protection ABC transporter MutE/EpiE family permease subunit
MFSRTFKAIKLSGKGQSSLKQIFFLPLGLSIFSFIIGTGFFQKQAAYFWFILLSPCILAILSASMDRAEKRETMYYTYFSTDSQMSQVWLSKILLILRRYSSMCFVLYILIGFTNWWLPIGLNSNPATVCLAIFLLIFTVAWQIPLTLLLSYRLGFVFPVVLNTIIGNILVLFSKDSLLSTLNPYANVGIILHQLMGVTTNGTPVDNVSGGDFLLILSSVGVSMLYFVVITFLTSKSFSKGGE